jgi:hypothetical protein
VVRGAAHTSFCDWPMLPLRTWSPARRALRGLTGAGVWKHRDRRAADVPRQARQGGRGRRSRHHDRQRRPTRGRARQAVPAGSARIGLNSQGNRPERRGGLRSHAIRLARRPRIRRGAALPMVRCSSRMGSYRAPRAHCCHSRKAPVGRCSSGAIPIHLGGELSPGVLASAGERAETSVYATVSWSAAPTSPQARTT